MASPADPHPGEVKILGRAGTVVIFNSHLWHGGTVNATGQPRRALHSYFCRRGLKQQLEQRACARPETLARLSPAAQYILGVLLITERTPRAGRQDSTPWARMRVPVDARWRIAIAFT